jgi:hypothetical protein
LPKIFKDHLVAQRIHRLPEALVPIRHQLAALSKLLQRLLLPNRFRPLEQIDDRRVDDKEAAGDPAAVSCRFFLEAKDAVAFEFQRP